MNSQQRKEAARKAEKTLSPRFVQLDLSVAPFVPSGMTRAFRNNRFTVMVYDNSETTHGPATKALIQSHYDKPIERHWATLQSIKNEIFGKEVTAIEYYPKESELINDHNIYWLWIFPEGVIPTMPQP